MAESNAHDRRLAELERAFARMHSVQRIQNLMGRYTVNFCPKNMHRALEFYALDQPDVSVEIGDRGVYIGAEAVRKLFGKSFAMSLPGNMLIHYLATPMIEVAEDGRTARGVWRSPGIEAVVPPGGGKPVPLWSFGTYAVDFIQQAGQWKIWHLKWFRIIKCTYRDAWVDDLTMAFSGRLPDAEGVGETTYHNPYTPESIQESVPPCPAPYGSWSAEDWMTREQDGAA